MMKKRSVKVRQGDNYIAYFVTYKDTFYTWVEQFWDEGQLEYTPTRQLYAETKLGCWLLKSEPTESELHSLKLNILAFELDYLTERLPSEELTVELFDRLFDLHDRYYLYWL